MAKVKVYRVGKLEIGNHSDELLSFWNAIDALKPSEHPTGRSNAIYVSPNQHGMARWIRSAIFTRCDIEVHEITIESDDVYCYEIPTYEGIPTSGSKDSERFIDNANKFWESGMTLTEWLEVATDEDGREAEILLDPSKIISSKKLSYAMVLNRVKKVANRESYVDEVKKAKDWFIS